jgi:hypothetical protein
MTDGAIALALLHLESSGFELMSARFPLNTGKTISLPRSTLSSCIQQIYCVRRTIAGARAVLRPHDAVPA